MKILAAFFLALALSAEAALTVALAPAVQNAARGTALVFTGTLTNTSATDKVFLNDIHATFAGGADAFVVLQTNDFFADVPGLLLPGEVYTGPIFRVALHASAPAGDYAATLSLEGGADLFASSPLASASFTVLSPDVSIVATDASASEFGPDSGIFTVARTGGTDIALDVPFLTSGSATNGTTYTLLPPAITIPAGAVSAVVTIAPIPDRIAQGDRSAILSLSPSAAFNAGTTTTATVTIYDLPADSWRWENFGPDANDPAAADGADWDADGIKNLVEYALNLDPKTASQSALPGPFLDGDFLEFSYVPNSTAFDVTYSVEATTDFALWSAADVEVVNVANPNPPNRVTVRYTHPVTRTEHAFLRLSITRP